MSLLDSQTEGAGQRPAFDLSDMISEINTHLSEEEVDQVRTKLIAKDQVRRFEVSMTILAQLLDEAPALVQGSADERLLAWRRCVAWVEELWTSAADSWRYGHYAVAAALSITTIEEAGKLAVERFRLLGANRIDMTSNAGAGTMAQWKRRTRPFRDHFTKHVMAATAGASVNARIDRLLGMDFVIAFLDDAENQRLEAFRQSCLYLDRSDVLLVPSETVKPEHAARNVALAGEILAELLPMPEDWTRVLDQVKAFERTAGLPHE
ncbi:MAG TPA: AbiV family abortive infection protein [Propionibacteriaceae bacterium]|nr:AbiV family abortive infection protein [Propionibacteriaceae bacterium]